jgi:hypothetical protein
MRNTGVEDSRHRDIRSLDTLDAVVPAGIAKHMAAFFVISQRRAHPAV